MPDHRNLKEHMKGTNLQTKYWRHHLEHNITKVDPCIDNWLRDEINGLKNHSGMQPVTNYHERKKKITSKGKKLDLPGQSKEIDGT